MTLYCVAVGCADAGDDGMAVFALSFDLLALTTWRAELKPTPWVWWMPKKGEAFVNSPLMASGTAVLRHGAGLSGAYLLKPAALPTRRHPPCACWPCLLPMAVLAWCWAWLHLFFNAGQPAERPVPHAGHAAGPCAPWCTSTPLAT